MWARALEAAVCGRVSETIRLRWPENSCSTMTSSSVLGFSSPCGTQIRKGVCVSVKAKVSFRSRAVSVKRGISWGGSQPRVPLRAVPFSVSWLYPFTQPVLTPSTFTYISQRLWSLNAVGEEPQTSPALRLSVQLGVMKKGRKRDSNFIDGHEQVTHISVLLPNLSSRLSQWEWSSHGDKLAERQPCGMAQREAGTQLRSHLFAS